MRLQRRSVGRQHDRLRDLGVNYNFDCASWRGGRLKDTCSPQAQTHIFPMFLLGDGQCCDLQILY